MKTCPNCGVENRDTARFCLNCRNPLPVPQLCAQCGVANSPNARFCKACGRPLQISQPVPPPAPQAAPQSGPQPVPPALQQAPFQPPQQPQPPQAWQPASVPQAPAAAPGLQPNPAILQTGKLPAHTILSGRYLVIEKIGQGGMGAVYKCQDTRLLGRTVAVKEMSDAMLTETAERQKAQENFKQEAVLLSSLNHQNLPRVTDFFTQSEKQYLVMDYLEGQTLEELIDSRTTPFSETQVLFWANQLCDALHYLHTHTPTIIFRDLKPGNIMVSPDGRTAKLIDFGIARLFKPGANKDTVALGTPGYAPPEQYGKGQSDARSDVYALGAVMHHALTLRDPGDDPFHFPPIRNLNSSVSAHVEAAILRAVEQQFDRRWQTIQEMRSVLCQMNASLPAGAAAFPAAYPAAYPAVFPVAVSPNAAAPWAVPAAGTTVPPAAPIPAPPPLQSPPPYNPNAAQSPGPYNALYPQQPLPGPYQPAPYGAPIPHRPAGVPVAAGLGARFAAYFIDGLLIGIVSTLITLPFISANDDALILYYSLILAWGIGYYTISHARSGQTPGKKASKIKVVCLDGSKVGAGRAFWRTLVYYFLPVGVSIAVSFMFEYLAPFGYLLILLPIFNGRHRGIHDVLAGTWVIEA